MASLHFSSSFFLLRLDSNRYLGRYTKLSEGYLTSQRLLFVPSPAANVLWLPKAKII